MIVQQMHRQRAFFDFVADYVGRDADRETTTAAVDAQMLEAFRRFLPQSQLAHARQPDGYDELEQLRRLAQDAGWNGSVVQALDSLQVAMDRRREYLNFPEAALPFIREGLLRELDLRLHGREASLLSGLQYDHQVQEALQLFENPARYQELLLAGVAD